MEREYWPTEGWRTSSPDAQGLSGDTLAHLHELALETDPPANGFLVVRHGYIVFEEYFRGFHEGSYHSVNSVTKRIVSALIGVAMRDRLLNSLDQPIVQLFPEIELDDERKQRITIGHVLTMTSGFIEHEHFPGALVRSEDPARLLWDRPLSHDPGEHFLYDNETPHVLSLVLSRLTAMSAADYALKELFAPLGIWGDSAARFFWRTEPFGPHTFFLGGAWPDSGLPWQTDHQGHSLGYAGAHFTLREMAKLGWLYLNQGRWDGRQLIPEAYVAESTRPHSWGMTPVGISAPTPYGYLWWLRDGSSQFVASGFGGQQVWIDPKADLVVAMASSPRLGAPALIGRVVIPSILD